jgi:hypothetical protein
MPPCNRIRRRTAWRLPAGRTTAPWSARATPHGRARRPRQIREDREHVLQPAALDVPDELWLSRRRHLAQRTHHGNPRRFRRGRRLRHRAAIPGTRHRALRRRSRCVGTRRGAQRRTFGRLLYASHRRRANGDVGMFGTAAILRDNTGMCGSRASRREVIVHDDRMRGEMSRREIATPRACLLL